MSGSWVAGSVRARMLASERRIGPAAARELAGSASLREALVFLAHTPYRRELSLDLDVAGAQRAVVSKTLVELRLLAGWLPPDALGLLRTLGAWYELANLEDRLAYLDGAPLRRPFELGGLAVAWPRASGAQSLEELRRALALSSWRDPGGETPAQAGLGLRLAWARRVAAEVPEARSWAAGAAALLLARELFVVGLPVERLPLPPVEVLGADWHRAGTFGDFVRVLPAHAAWALAGFDSAQELWLAEAGWWRRLEEDADVFAHSTLTGPLPVIGAVALLAADAHRVATALAAVDRQGLTGVAEVFDAAA